MKELKWWQKTIVLSADDCPGRCGGDQTMACGRQQVWRGQWQGLRDADAASVWGIPKPAKRMRPVCWST